MLDTPVQASVGQEKEEFIFRIVALDYYMARPVPGLDVCYSQLEGTAIERVPVIQIYGSTPGGQKTCLHLHKVRTGLGATRKHALQLPAAGSQEVIQPPVCFGQAFPYFYVPYEDDFPAEASSGEDPCGLGYRACPHPCMGASHTPLWLQRPRGWPPLHRHEPCRGVLAHNVHR